MEAPTATHAYPTALGALRTLARQKWIVLATAIVITGLSVFMANRQTPLYQSSATVLLKFQNLASGLTGIQDLSTVYQDPARIAETQTQVAMSPAVGQRVAAAAKIPDLGPNDVLGMSSVSASPDADVLYFTVTATDPQVAEKLATMHANAYIGYRQALDNSALVAARKELRGRIEELRQGEFAKSPLVSQLIQTEQQLRTMEALQTSNASLLRPAEGSIQTQPKVFRSAVLGIVLGLMLGVGLAFARDALDTRIRSTSDISEALGIPMLGRISTPPKNLRKTDTLVMNAKPRGNQAESFRVLRSNLDFVNVDRGARSILVTSALEAEGKSTTASNLAIVLAHGGRRVALVDLDLRRPSLGRFFDVPITQPGLTSVVLGKATLDEALIDVFGRRSHAAPQSNGSPPEPRVAHDGDGHPGPDAAAGVLTVLTAGLTPPNPGEFVTSPRVEAILRRLSDEFDLVIVDTPPLLSVGDAMALSASVDALICVTRLNVLRRPNVHELARALGTCPTIKLGYVATGADAEHGYGYTSYDYNGPGFDYDVSLPHGGRAVGEKVM